MRSFRGRTRNSLLNSTGVLPERKPYGTSRGCSRAAEIVLDRKFLVDVNDQADVEFLDDVKKKVEVSLQ